MSEKFPDPDLPESDPELESLLKKLEPSPVDFSLLRALNREYELTSAEFVEIPEPAVQWKRLLPLATLGLLGMLAYASFQYGPHLDPREPSVAEAATAASAPSMESSLEPSGFLPVSAQGFLVNTSSAGIIETEEGPREKMSLEYRDAYHWHDPETGTNIRFFQPRSEEVIVTLPAD